ncbi:MAG: hypothetical protein JW884_12035 [Deltaproteobacteria bacterium]|nr:hypothetical protein [Deltaproteobacteria bacterium]
MSDLDNREIYCLKLGHPAAFRYCRIEGGDIPCPRILNCWQPFFDAASHLRDILTEDQWNRCFGEPPKSKIDRIFETVARVKNNPDG